MNDITERQIKYKENEIKRLVEKKYVMREYREKIKNIYFENMPKDIQLQIEIKNLKIEVEKIRIEIEEKHKEENKILNKEIYVMRNNLEKLQRADLNVIKEKEKIIEKKTGRLELLRKNKELFKGSKDRAEYRKRIYVLKRYNEITQGDRTDAVYDYYTNNFNGYDKKTAAKIRKLEKEYYERKKKT